MSELDIEKLMKFYQVETMEQLISAQDAHIERLQKTVAELKGRLPDLTEKNPGYSPRGG